MEWTVHIETAPVAVSSTRQEAILEELVDAMDRYAGVITSSTRTGGYTFGATFCVTAPSLTEATWRGRAAFENALYAEVGIVPLHAISLEAAA